MCVSLETCWEKIYSVLFYTRNVQKPNGNSICSAPQTLPDDPRPLPGTADGGGRGRVNPPRRGRRGWMGWSRRREEYRTSTLNHPCPEGWWDYDTIATWAASQRVSFTFWRDSWNQLDRWPSQLGKKRIKTEMNSPRKDSQDELWQSARFVASNWQALHAIMAP